MMNVFKRILQAVAVFVAVLVLALVVAALQPPSDPAWGVTFSPRYARQLGLDAGETFHWMLGDLGVKRVRFPLYWDEIERTPGVYDFSDAEWYLWDAASRGVEVTLVVGQRSPRWPECHIPTWVGDNASGRHAALLAYVQAVTTQFKDHPAVARWQIENEPFFSLFGICPETDTDVLDAEVALARGTGKPVQLTASGELESWVPSGKRADVLGVSLYRTSWNQWMGYVRYPLPAAFYRLRSWMIRPVVDQVVVSELQAEPWFPDLGFVTDVEMGAGLFSAQDLRDHATYVQRTGVSEAYFWGVEWWYFMKQHGHAEYWDAARTLFTAP